jgi:hypothetical protein
MPAEGMEEPPVEVVAPEEPTPQAASREATTGASPGPAWSPAKAARDAPAPTAGPAQVAIAPASSSETAGAPASAQGPADASRLPALLGSRLDRVVELVDGRMVAVVDTVDEVTRTAAEWCGAVAVPRAAVEPLSLLGDASPFARAKVVATGLATERDAEGERRREAAALARRKLRAAEAMVAAELPAEAIVAARDAMMAAVSGLGAGTEPDLPAARLLFEILVPAGRLTLEQAALVAKADGLARAYGGAAVPPPTSAAQSVLADARRVVGDLGP